MSAILKINVFDYNVFNENTVSKTRLQFLLLPTYILIKKITPEKLLLRRSFKIGPAKSFIEVDKKNNN